MPGIIWNSGLFVMKASVWRDAIGRCRPDILSACERAGRCADRWGFRARGQGAFAACPSDSIDYAVMERIAAGVAGLPAGGDSAFGRLVGRRRVGFALAGPAKDEAGNAWRGDVMLHDTAHTLAFSESRLVACVGVRDLVVVETPDAVLVAHKRIAPRTSKKIAERLKQEARGGRRSIPQVHRPWGSSRRRRCRASASRSSASSSSRAPPCRCRCIIHAPSTG